MPNQKNQTNHSIRYGFLVLLLIVFSFADGSLASESPASVAPPAKKAATGTLNRDAALIINLADITVSETNANVAHNFVATLSEAAPADVVISFSTTNGTAGATDFIPQSAVLYTIPAGALSVNIPVTIIGDAVTEPQEAFTGTVQISNANGQTVSVGTGTATCTINDDDSAVLSITGFSVNEGAGTGNFTVTLSGSVQDAFKVDFATFNGTATKSEDYTTKIKTFNFGGVNSSSQTVAIAILEDDLVESDETVRGTLSNLTLVNPVGQHVTLAGDGPSTSATSTILDNDAASLAISDAATTEAAGATASFTVTLTGHIQNALTVDYATQDATATHSEDYTTTTGSLTFPAGSASGTNRTISVPIVNDNICEAAESFTVGLNNLSFNGACSFTRQQATGTITDDDPVGSLNLSGFTATEGDAGSTTGNFTATMSNAAQQPVVLSFSTTNGTAGAGDFTPQTNVQYTILPGNLSVNIPVAVLGDLVVEPQESFTGDITLVNANGQNVTLGTHTATGTINDNDAAVVPISDIGGAEDAGPITVTLLLDHAVQGGFTVDVNTADGTATVVGNDYTPVTGRTIVFAGVAGETHTFTVSPTADTNLEPDETVQISMNNLALTTLPVNISNGATLTIRNDDGASVTVADVTGAENGGPISVTLVLDHAVQGGFTVDVNTADGTATLADHDYTGISGQTITFAGTAGESHIVELNPTPDEILEPNETVLVNLTHLAGTNLPVNITDGATITITNDDAASVKIADVSGAEDGGPVTVTLVLDNAVMGGFTVDVNTADGTATVAGNDYTAVTGKSITFAGTAGETHTFSIVPTADAILEPNETILVSMTNLSGTALPVDITDGAIVTLTNDDVASVTIADVSGAEDGGPITVTAVLDHAVQGGFKVDVNTADGTARLSNNDYSAVINQTLTFAGTAGESQTFTIMPTADAILEPNETVLISMTNLSGSALPVNVSDGATLTITNDDRASVTIADAAGAENSGPITVTLVLDHAVEGGFTVDVKTTDGTATLAGKDYTQITGQTITFAGTAGETHTFTVSPTADEMLEPDEMILVGMTNLSGTTLPVDISDGATVTITNDDAASVRFVDAPEADDVGLRDVNILDVGTEIIKQITDTLITSHSVQGGFSVDNQADLFVPNSFSPNGDGIHDYFRIRSIGNYSNPVIEIFNRWGNLVFRKEHYGDPVFWGGETEAWWNGRSNTRRNASHTDLPVGTYYYILKLNSTRSLTGFIYLNR